jgi:outer membrane protein assembly factor BamB
MNSRRDVTQTGAPRGAPLGALKRRAALLAPFALPLALGGCDWLSNLFEDKKAPLAGKRESVFSNGGGLNIDGNPPRVSLPPPVRNAAWPQVGGNPAHLMGHLAAAVDLREAWSADIGTGGGYRQVLMASPVVLNDIVFTMDSAGVVSAFTAADGRRLWRFDTKPDDADSTNVGGGLGADGTTLYAVNGLSQLVALELTTGKVKWRTDIGVPGRSPPMIADGRLFLTTIEDRLLAYTTADGRQLWTHQATNPVTALLGQPAPAYYRGLVIAGFGSGELVCLRADSGAAVWTDGLGEARPAGSVGDFLSIRGTPVVVGGQVFAISVGGLLVSDDVPSGRRLWERQVAGEDTVYAAGDWMFIISAQQELAAIRLADGVVAWVSPLPRYENPEKSRGPITWYGPLLVGDRLIVSGTSKQALSISPYTGDITGKIDLSSQAAPFAPVVAGGTVYLVTNDARLLALR